MFSDESSVALIRDVAGGRGAWALASPGAYPWQLRSRSRPGIPEIPIAHPEGAGRGMTRLCQIVTAPTAPARGSVRFCRRQRRCAQQLPVVEASLDGDRGAQDQHRKPWAAGKPLGRLRRQAAACDRFSEAADWRAAVECSADGWAVSKTKSWRQPDWCYVCRCRAVPDGPRHGAAACWNGPIWPPGWRRRGARTGYGPERRTDVRFATVPPDGGR